MRKFNDKEIELLAPAGNFDILKDLIHTNCDAFYFGGKQFNMRMHRSNFNFSNEEIKNSIELAHENNKKVYITINNLMYDQELSGCLEYLYYLNELSPDGLIIQDMSIITMINDNKLDLPMHSSVMMNVHNLEMVKKLSSLGVSRVVASREIDLQTIRYWDSQCSMEFEYFVHGDMCSVHGSQCYYSTMLFGSSGNRGLCMKPCRWDYKIKYLGGFYNTEFPMAVKDMYMYENIPELIHAGVNSFKIEGRMRESSYLSSIITSYGDTIDRYIEDPVFYDRYKDSESLHATRMRDFSTAYAFGNPKLDYINRRYEGTGYFYSTGKVFSKPISEHSIDEKQIEKAKSLLSADPQGIKNFQKLAVRCDTVTQIKIAIQQQVDIIYVNTDNFNRNHGLSLHSLIEISENKGNSKIVLALPKITFDRDFEKYDVFFNNKNIINALDGIMVSNLGALEHYKKYNLPMYSDITMNISNTVSNQFYLNQGLKNTVIALEMDIKNLKNFLGTSQVDNLEIIAHGSPTIMYMDLDLYENIIDKNPIYSEDNIFFENDVLVLVDDKGFEHPVYRDSSNKNHLLLYNDICLLPIQKELSQLGVSIYRLEICHYTPEDFEAIIVAYKRALSEPDAADEIYKNLKPNHMSFSLGSLYY